MFKFLKKARKFIASVFIIVLLVLSIIFIPDIPETIDSSFMLSMHTDSAPKLIAHRGLSSLFPENTLPAFAGAAEYHFDAFEFDIHTTKDGEWIVIHDDDVDNMTDGTGDVDSYTLKEIRELNIDNGNYIGDFDNIRVPTLEETLELNIEQNITPVIEIKKCDIQYLPSLKEMLDEYGLSEKAVMISFTREYLEEYRKIDSDTEMLLLATAPTKEDIDWCSEYNAGINFNCWSLYKCFGAIRYAKQNGVKIAAWTVDNPVFADVMVLFGAEYITTNKILP